MKPILFLLLIFFCNPIWAQVSVNTTNTPAHPSSMLDVTSINKGLLLPRMSSALRTAIASPAKGLIVYDSTANTLWYYDGTAWQEGVTANNNLWKQTGNDIYNANTANIGVGTNAPNTNALLHVNTGTSITKGLLISGTYNGTSTVPNLGAGSRMMFYPGQAAFRAGMVSGTQWNNVNTGFYSAALGYNTTASGDGSVAMGFNTTASGAASMAFGQSVIANGGSSTALGFATSATGDYSTAMGNSTTAGGSSATAMGYNTTAGGYYSTAMGYLTKAKGYASTVIGLYNDTLPNPIGTYITPTAPLFIIGNGTPADNSRTNAFVVAKNGRVYIDPSDKNSGDLNNALLFGSHSGTAEGISSKRTAGGNLYGLDFFTSDANRMSITNGGNVGIGISTPGERLTVESADNINTTNIAAFYQGSLSQGIGFGYDEIRKIGNVANSILFINAKGTGDLILQNTATGDVGIGTAIPAAKLDVNGTVKVGATGTPLISIIKHTPTVNVPAVAANASLIQFFTVVNAAIGSTVYVSPSAALADGLEIAYARVSSAGTVEVKFRNVTAATIDPPLMDFYITVIQ